jgi:RecA/RadA recombinase
MATVKMKGPKDAMSKVLAKLSPTREGEKPRAYEVSRSSQEAPLSQIKYVLTTGIDPFDAYTGYLPFGRIVEFYGVEGSAKTAWSMRACGRAQQRHIYERVTDVKTGVQEYKQIDPDLEVVILYIDNEQSLDEGQKIVVDGLEVDAIIGRCDTVDDLFKMIDDTIDVVAKITLETEKQCFIIVVVDTIAAMVTQSELDAEWGTQDFPRAPKALRAAFSMMTRKINRHNVLMICTNQVSESFKPKKKTFSNPFSVDLPRPEDFSSSGGRAIRFYASLRIFFFQVNMEYKLSKGNVGGPSGFVGGFITVKNRQVKPRREGRFVLLYDSGISNTYSILETMFKCKVAARGEKGVIEFRFRAHGIATTTFDPTSTRINSNPKIEGNAAWPAFYEAHKPDLDLLWEKAKELTFSEATDEPEDEEED